MNSTDKLTKEIIIRIFDDLGIVPGSAFGKFGLTVPELLTHDKIISEDEETEQRISLDSWAGIIDLKSSKLRAMVLKVDEDPYEFILTFRMDDMAIYAMKLMFDELDCGVFVLLNDSAEGSFIEAGVYDKAQALAGIETINQLGVEWKRCNEFSDLKRAIMMLVEG